MTGQTKFFETVATPAAKTEDVYCAGERDDAVWFRPVEVAGEALDALMEEASKWEVVDTYEWAHENLVYNDLREGSGERVIPSSDIVSFLEGSFRSNEVRGGYLLRDGAFAGVILKLQNTSSYGMSYSQNTGFGALFVDGSKVGQTEYHYSHCSTEKDEEHSSVYSLRRATGEGGAS